MEREGGRSPAGEADPVSPRPLHPPPHPPPPRRAPRALAAGRLRLRQPRRRAASAAARAATRVMCACILWNAANRLHRWRSRSI